MNLRQAEYDAVVAGAGPNGLAAGIVFAQAGKRVLLVEATSAIGGGVRTAEITIPGFLHDLCSAVYPLGVGSPFFRTLPLEREGLDWIHPPAAVAHPFDDGSVVLVQRSIDATAEQLGSDAERYRELFGRLAAHWAGLEYSILAPPRWPRDPIALARFGWTALQPAGAAARRIFREPRARALFAGLAAHSMLPLENYASSAFALVLGATAHVHGWPIVRGGSQKLADALADYFRSLGGAIALNRPVRSLADLPPARITLLDFTPRQLLGIGRGALPSSYRRRLRKYRYGMAAFKVDWAISEPVPWRNSGCRQAATVHLGGTLEEIARAERLVWRGLIPDRPFVLLAQPSLFDASRAPPGKHTLWAYCHVPNGCDFDMTNRIEAQIERFAPGFRETILARTVSRPADLERRNANLVGGDINGGAPLLGQLLFRPTRSLYATPVKGLYLCSAATPPGGGVHGMCGYFAAQRALRDTV